MKKIIYLLFLLITSVVQAQQANVQGKLIIIGGGSRPDALVERIIQEAGLRSGGYVAILPMSSAEPDSSVYYAKQQFLKKQITALYGFNFKKGEAISSLRVDSVRNAKLIYITGGDQNRFMEIVRGTEIEKAIHDAYKNGSVISGTSAGAAVMSKHMITGQELKHLKYTETFKTIEAENVELKVGLGLLPTAIIDQHFLIRSRHNRLLSAVIEHPELLCIGIDEATAILVAGKDVEVLGDSQVLVYTNPRKSKKILNSRLGATGLRLNVYLPGDTFRLP